MRTVSTGVGLCVLGVCVLGAAALSSPRLGNAAIAAGGAQRSSLPATAIRPEPNPMQRNSMPSNSSLTDCEVRVEHWFSPVPHLLREGCVEQYALWNTSFSMLDLLGNNKPLVVAGASQSSGTLSVHEFRQLPDGSTETVQVAILSPSDSELWINFEALGLGIGSWDYMNGGGFADMDGDGDLDLVLTIWTQDVFQRVWLENIRGDAVRQSPYDLDRNGSVNTADLSLLLMEFTD